MQTQWVVYGVLLKFPAVGNTPKSTPSAASQPGQRLGVETPSRIMSAARGTERTVRSADFPLPGANENFSTRPYTTGLTPPDPRSILRKQAGILLSPRRPLLGRAAGVPLHHPLPLPRLDVQPGDRQAGGGAHRWAGLRDRGQGAAPDLPGRGAPGRHLGVHRRRSAAPARGRRAG